MMRLIKLVGPLTGYMALAVVMGVLGNACASSITILGGFAVARVLGLFDAVSLGALFAVAAAAAVARGLLRHAEQSCNHFIAFKLLALIRDRVFGALRRLCPAKLEGDKGDLISVITGDIELLEVFYAHTVSPVCIAVLFCAAMIVLIGRYMRFWGFLPPSLISQSASPCRSSPRITAATRRFVSARRPGIFRALSSPPCADWTRSCSTAAERIV